MDTIEVFPEYRKDGIYLRLADDSRAELSGPHESFATAFREALDADIWIVDDPAAEPTKPTYVASLLPGASFRVGQHVYTLVRTTSGGAVVRSAGVRKRVQFADKDFVAQSGDQTTISLGTIVDEVL